MTILTGTSGDLYVDDGGSSGLAVLMAHSFAGSSDHWKAQLAHLRPRRRTIALDFRSHGHSAEPGDGDYSVQAMAADIAAVADQLELRRFVLVGHSMGGSAAAAYAGANAGRLAGLVLAGTPGKSPPEQALQILGSLEADYDKVMAGYWNSLLEGAQPEVHDRVEAGMHKIGRDASMKMIRALFEYDPLPALANFHGPKLIIDTAHGDGPAALHNQLPDITRKVIEGTSHWPQLDKPQEFNRLLDEFLAWMA
jgi:pimeloyl-ACP methyl ester carboxylesterase